MSKVFVSYSRADSDFVDRLDSELEQRGFDVWIDRSDIGGGAAWRAEIAQAIRECETFVLVFSPRAAGSVNISKELALADKYGKVILPVVLEHHPIPESMEYQLAGLQQIAFSETSFTDGFQRLLKVLPTPESTPQTIVSDEPAIPQPEPIRGRGDRRRVIVSVSIVATLTILVVLAIRFGPSIIDTGSPVDSDFLNQDSAHTAFEGGYTGAEEVLEQDRDNTGASEIVRQTRTYSRPGVHAIDIPSDWFYTDLSDFNKTFERFSDPSSNVWLDVEVAAFGYQVPDEVLSAYMIGWQSSGMIFVEDGRRNEYGGWLVEGSLASMATGATNLVSLFMTTEGPVNGNLAFYSSSFVDASERYIVFEEIRRSFVLLPVPNR